MPWPRCLNSWLFMVIVCFPDILWLVCVQDISPTWRRDLSCGIPCTPRGSAFGSESRTPSVLNIMLTYLINWKNDFVDQQIPVVNGDCVSCNAEIWSESQMSEERWMWWLTSEKFHKRSSKRSDTSKYKKSISIKTPERRSLVGHSAGSIFLDTLESISWIIYRCSSEFHHLRFNSNVL